MGERRALGKGLAALLGEQSTRVNPVSSASAGASMSHEAGGPGVRVLPIDRIGPNPDQPRERFDSEALQELAASIAQDGIIQPIVVRETGDAYTIIAGERRWRAARLAGLTLIPALIHRVQAPTDSLRLALIENIQRRDLNPLEEARAYQELIQRCGLTQEQLAQQVCKSRSAITNTLRLLNLPPEVQQLLADGRVSMGHARALLALPTQDAQIKLARRVAQDGLSVRETERLTNNGRVRKISPETTTHVARVTDPYFADIESRLRSALGTKVLIKPTGPKSGSITLEYYSLEELQGILEKVGIRLAT